VDNKNAGFVFGMTGIFERLLNPEGKSVLIERFSQKLLFDIGKGYAEECRSLEKKCPFLASAIDTHCEMEAFSFAPEDPEEGFEGLENDGEAE